MFRSCLLGVNPARVTLCIKPTSLLSRVKPGSPVLWTRHSQLRSIITESGSPQNQISPFIQRKNQIQGYKPFQFNTPSLSTRRLLSTRPPSTRFYSNGRSSFPQVRYFSISPIKLFFTVFITVTLFLTILPILFQLTLPLIILAIILYQFNKWKRSQFYRQLIQILPKSEITIPYKTLNSLQYSFLPERISMMNDFLNELSKLDKFDINPQTKRDAHNFIAFIETRIMESLAINESGIRSYLFTNNNKYRWFQRLQSTPSFKLQLDSKRFKTYGERVPQSHDIMLSLQYPLKLILVDETNPTSVLQNQRIYLGTVTLTVLDNSSSSSTFKSISELASTNASCKLVISLIPVSSISSPIPKQFIISTWGESGKNFNKFNVKRTPDGHTEYTMKR